jgi:subtilisin-like proprotein convertase family protein
MNFRCTARDNSPLNGTIADADVSLVFTDQAGPFRVTTQNTSEEWVAFSTEIVEWDVAGTDQSPVSCSQVDILMSLDGGITYDVEVAMGVENNGLAEVTVPNVESNNARIMVVCSDNVFFDINNTSLSVRSTQFLLSADPSTISSCDADVVSTDVEYSPVGNFNETVSFSVDGLPENVMASFSENEISTAGTVTLEFSGLTNAQAGVYNIELIGTGETENYQTIIKLEIYRSVIASPVQSNPSNGEKGVDARPSFGWELDGNVSEYDLQLSTNPGFTDMETFTFEDFTSGNLIPQDLTAGTVYYWRLIATNPCAMDEAISGLFSFQTGGEVCESYSALTNNLPILSIGPNEVRSLLSVNNNASISRMTASVDISHDNVGDLVLDVLSPSNGPSITLMNRPGVPATTIGCTGNDIDVTFDDQAVLTADDLENECQNTAPAISGSYQSVEPLSQFTGLNSVGIWILEVNDFRTGGGGTMNTWSLEICSLQELDGEVILTNTGLNVNANTNAAISAMELNVSDMSPDQVVYTLLEGTQYGDLSLDDGTGNLSLLKIGSTFTQDDLDNSLINYASGDGTESEDVFVFDVVNSEGFWSSTNQFTINIITALSASIDITSEISCFGATDGSLTVNAVGGNPEYLYSIDGITFQDSPVFDDLGAGNYNIIVKDSDDVFIEISIELTEPLEIFVDVDQAGYTITILAEQGVEPYMYSLNGIDFQTDPVFQVPGEGNYTAIVVDANGCMSTNEFFVMASSVNDLNSKLSVRISPNPGSGIYTMTFNTDQGLQLTMRVFDVVGKELYKEYLDVKNQFSKVLDMTSFANGNYVIYLEDEKGYSASYQLIKN